MKDDRLINKFSNKKIPAKNTEFKTFFEKYGIFYTHHQTTLVQAINRILDMVDYEVRFNYRIAPSLHITEAYKKASELIEGSYNFVIIVGCEKFILKYSPRDFDFIGELLLLLQNSLWVAGDCDRLLRVLCNDIPKIENEYPLNYRKGSIDIYLTEIIKYAENDELNKASLLYEEVSNLKKQFYYDFPSELEEKKEFLDVCNELLNPCS